MNNEMTNIQHPDITHAERTGFPFSYKVEVEVTDKIAFDFCYKQFSEFWDFVLVCHADVITGFLDDNRDSFEEYLMDI